MAVQPIPAAYGSLTPYLIVGGAAEAIEFYKRAFGAVEMFRMPMPNGKLGHAEIKIGDSVLMLADEAPEWGNKSPLTLGGSPVHILLYVENVDEVVARAVAAGATLQFPVTDQFYGDRSGRIIDPFGHAWAIATHVEDVAHTEVNRRFEEMMAKGQGECT